MSSSMRAAVASQLVWASTARARSVLASRSSAGAANARSQASTKAAGESAR
jgi:hypothetical protein